MDEATKDILETVNFIKDHMATKSDLEEVRQELKDGLEDVRQELKADIKGVQDEIVGIKNRLGAIDNRIDDEAAARKNLETRVRKVVPKLPAAPERV